MAGRTLLDAGAQVNARTNSGLTALMMTGNETGVEVVWTLISAGAKVNRRDEEERVEVIKLLEAYGAHE